MAGSCACGVAACLLRRDPPALMGITAIPWAEAALWLDDPRPHGSVNKLLTVGLIPLALLAQAWGPRLG